MLEGLYHVISLKHLERIFVRRKSADKNLNVQELNAYGLMRDIRVHGQDMQRSVADIKSSLALLDGDTAKKQLSEALARNQPAFDRNKKNIYDLLGQIRVLFRERPDL